MDQLIIYGAYGYTGELITEQAVKMGIKPLLSGRNEHKLKQVADKFSLEYRVCDLEDNALEELLKDGSVVIHAAGPFVHTARPMIQACLKTNTHYLDITGEIDVFELSSGYDQQAKDAGIMVMSGTGFDVVPSDCLAAHLKQRLPDANRLELAFAGLGGGMSRGTAKSVVENLGNGGAIREDHKIKKVPAGHKTRKIDFGEFKMLTVCIPWGDVSTAYHSTGIPNIEVFTGANKGMVRGMKISNHFEWLLQNNTVRNFLKKQINKQPPGPSEKRRQKSTSYFWGKVMNESGQSKISTLKTAEGYTLTALTSVAIAQEVLNRSFKIGFQTPSMAYGADFILKIEGVDRKDID